MARFNDYIFYNIRIYILIFPGASALSGSYTEGAKAFHIIDLNCDGTEENIFNCSYNSIVQHTCSDYEDAYVRCPGM